MVMALCLCGVLGGCVSDAPPIVAPSPAEVARVRGDIAALCGPGMEGRGVGTAGIGRARDWIAQRFDEVGLGPGVRVAAGEGRASYLQTVPVFTDDGDITLHNVVGVLPGRGALADEFVVVGAHYDHLGFGHHGSRDPAGAGRLHPGADDNASGIAAMLRVAEALAHAHASSDEPSRLVPEAGPTESASHAAHLCGLRPPRLGGEAAQRGATDGRGFVAERRSIAFVAFTAEETGLLGSHYFALHPEHLGGGARVVAMVNLDMVGNLTDFRLRVWGVGSGDGLRATARQANAGVGLRLQLEAGPGVRSDHVSFHGRGIPAVLLITDVHGRYHTPADTPDHVNHAGVARVARYAGALAELLATQPAAPGFVAWEE